MTTVDIVIVGAGLAGLYAGFTLAKKGFAADGNTMIFDAAPYIGGRLKTLYTKTAMPVNLGANRINLHLHKKVHALLRDLGLSYETCHYQNKSSDFSVEKKNIATRYLQILAILRQRYLQSPFPDNKSFTNCFDGSCLPTGLQLLSNKDLQMLVSESGYDVLLNSNLSLAEALRILDQHPETEVSQPNTANVWQQITLGIHTIIMRLSQLLHKAHVPIFTAEKLIAIQPRRNRFDLTFKTSFGYRFVRTKKLILALPQRALKAIEYVKQNFSDALNAIQTVPLFKCFLYFPYVFWQDSLPFFVIMNHPLRKIYFNAERKEIWFYADSGSALYWQTFTTSQTVMPTTGTQYHRFIQEIRQGLAKLLQLPLSAIPTPNECYYQFWEEGVSFWKTHYNPKKINNWCINNGSGVHLICDMFSPQSGWMEGALDNVSNMILQWKESHDTSVAATKLALTNSH